MVGLNARSPQWFTCNLFNLFLARELFSEVSILLWNGTKLKGYTAQCHETFTWRTERKKEKEKKISQYIQRVVIQLFWLKIAGNWASNKKGWINFLEKFISHNCQKCVNPAINHPLSPTFIGKVNRSLRFRETVADTCSKRKVRWWTTLK